MIIAEAAGDRRSPGKILFDERTHHIALEALLLVHDVIWDANVLGYPARIVYVVDRAATPLHRLRHAFMPGEPALVPQLHGEPDDVVSVRAQHGCDGGGIHTARHGYGNGCGR